MINPNCTYEVASYLAEQNCTVCLQGPELFKVCFDQYSDSRTLDRFARIALYYERAYGWILTPEFLADFIKRKEWLTSAIAHERCSILTVMNHKNKMKVKPGFKNMSKSAFLHIVSRYL